MNYADYSYLLALNSTTVWFAYPFLIDSASSFIVKETDSGNNNKHHLTRFSNTSPTPTWRMSLDFITTYQFAVGYLGTSAFVYSQTTANDVQIAEIDFNQPT